jgi:hypothetical protein
VIAALYDIRGNGLERRRTAYPGAEPAAMSREAWLDWVEAHVVGA